MTSQLPGQAGMFPKGVFEHPASAHQVVAQLSTAHIIGVLLPRPAGSPLISRTSWQALLAAQGFQHVLVSGCDVPAPPLLARQSVVLGVSDGVIRRPDFAAVAAARARRPAAAPMHMQPATAAPVAASGPDVALILQVSKVFWVTSMTFR
jgi:hypothetical protein